MRISETPLAILACAGAVLYGAQALAFEVKSSEPVDAAPSRALSALPSAPAAGLPELGVDRRFRDMWRGFVQSYRSGDKQAALKQLEAAAESGDILAQWKLGRMYADGDVVRQDDYRAFRLFSRIADARADESRDSLHAGVVANAFVALGIYWLDGIPHSPVKANPAEAAKAFHYAASYYGHPEAQYQLARLMIDSKQDAKVALRWLNLAAAKGHVLAQAMLGRMLFLGEATQRQPQRGLMWLQVARENPAAERYRWVVETHRKAFDAASEEDRALAQQQAQRFLRAAQRE